jgi:hydrogenase expression/formation protein HypE
MTEKDEGFALNGPAPAGAGETVQLAHGGGGRAMARLIDTIIRPAFSDAELERRHDGAVLALDGPVAFTTDSYVVQPLFFPGGDIGTLAVNGTVNDLAMCAATPLYLSAGFILEEGLEMDILRRVVASMRDACAAARVSIVTGDIKVVDRGAADGLFINTSGIGRIYSGADVGPERVRPGDLVLVSGDIARHGMAVLNAREDLGFDPPIESDCAPLANPVLALLEAGIEIHCLRDLTRGGLASSLVEIAETAGVGIGIEESEIPVRDDVAAACELLGLEPIYVATEGRFVAFVAAQDGDRALELLRQHPVCASARVIGEVRAAPPRQVWSAGFLGGKRAIDMLNGEQLPRIC